MIEKVKLINRAEAIRYLGYGNDEPEKDMLEEISICEKELLAVMEPKHIIMESEVRQREEGIEVTNGLILTGEAIKIHLAGCEKALLCCATLSDGVDALIDKAQRSDMLKALLLDACANAAVEELRLIIEKDAERSYPEYDIIWQFGIGYGDLPLCLQHEFLKILKAENIGMRVNESHLLIPMKSVSGIIGLRKKEISDRINALSCKKSRCVNCTVQDCIYHKDKE